MTLTAVKVTGHGEIFQKKVNTKKLAMSRMLFYLQTSFLVPIESLRVYHSGFYSHSHVDPWKFSPKFTL